MKLGWWWRQVVVVGGVCKGGILLAREKEKNFAYVSTTDSNSAHC